MFLTNLNSSPLVGTAADEIFANITGDAYRGDVSFLSAMRMLLYDRLPEGASAALQFIQSDYSAVKGLTVDKHEEIFRALTGYSGEMPENHIWFVDVQCSGKDESTTAHKNFGKVKQIMGMSADPMVDNAYAKMTQAHTYIDPEHSRTLILVSTEPTL